MFEENFPEARYSKGEMSFVFDGILDKKEWDKQDVNTMFLLRESYEASKWYRIAVDKIDPRKGKNSNFFKNILLYKHAIDRVMTNWDVTVDSPDYKLFNEWKDGNLNTIAYFDVKKFLGTSTSNFKDIMNHVRNTKHSNGLTFKELLKRHIDLINPEVVYCDDITYFAYKEIFDIKSYKGNGKTLFQSKLIKENILPKLYKHDYKTEDDKIKSRLLVRYYHPSYFKGGIKLYKKLLKGMINLEKDNGPVNLYDEFHTKN